MERYKLLEWLIILITTIIISYALSIGSVKAEDKVITLDSEITRLSKQYAVNEKKVRAIIKCESQMYGSAVNHNLDSSGKVWSSDFGLLQINDYYHEDAMNKLGLDIHDQFDSLEYGFLLISKQGYKPWTASIGCWQESDTKKASKSIDK